MTHPDGRPPTPEEPTEPEVEPPAAIPDESTLTPAPVEDDGSLVPTQLPDAPEFIPTAMGMTSGVVISPPAPEDVSSSAWVTTAPERPARGFGPSLGLAGILGGLVALGVVAFVLASAFGLLPNNRGKVLFGTGRGADLCHVANPTSTLKASEPLFFAAVLRENLDGNATVTLHITKDGAELVEYDDSQNGQPFGCYGNVEALSPFEPGQYHFEVLYNGAVQAAGDVTITE